MLSYLSRKIAMPNQRRVKSIAVSSDYGYIACGAENGLLKVLKLDDNESQSVDLNVPKNLSMNQTLEGHDADVMLVIWNDKYHKLTSSDANGVIIVWMLYKNVWYEEMVNNRNKSNVIGMSWCDDGSKICIIYEDGAVIVGTVEGNRLWAKEMKSIKLLALSWSPDGNSILFGSTSGQVYIYDQLGNNIGKILPPMIEATFSSSKSLECEIASIDWCKNRLEGNSLIIAFINGFIQIMCNERDDSPKIVDSKMLIVSVLWNYFGNVFAVAGRLHDNQSNVIKFYDKNGNLMQTLDVPGKEITSCSWEKRGLRLAIGVDYYIFFANIRPDYKWAYFSSTLIIGLPFAAKSSDDDYSGEGKTCDTVMFFNFNTNTKHVKSIKNLTAIAGHGQYCVFSTTASSRSLLNNDKLVSLNGLQNNIESDSIIEPHSSLILCNSIGVPVDSTSLDLSVSHLAINSDKAIAASNNSFTIWILKTPKNYKRNTLIADNDASLVSQLTKSLISQRKSVSSRPYSNATAFSEFGSEFDDVNSIYPTMRVFDNKSGDKITCLSVSEELLVIGCESKTCLVYDLLEVNCIYKINLSVSPRKLCFNSDCSKLSIIDAQNSISICDTNIDNISSSVDDETKMASILFEKKDVWDFCWSQDAVDCFAIVKRAKLILFNQLEADESLRSSGLICEFKDLIVRVILIDHLIMKYTFADSHNVSNTDCSSDLSEFMVEHEVKLLRKTREKIKQLDSSEIVSFIESNSHPKLWRILAESSIELLNFKQAEFAFVKCKDYKSVQFLKRVSKMSTNELKKGEIFAYFNQFKEAEKVFMDCDRHDLAINLHKTVGNWCKVVELLENNSNCGSDLEMKQALNNWADNCMDEQNWLEASKLYSKCENWTKLYKCYRLTENYSALFKLIDYVENDELLLKIGWTFECNGLCMEAEIAYRKANRVDLALKCCINLNEWKNAIELAQNKQIADVDMLLSKYSQQLMAKGRHFDVIELFRKANRINDTHAMLIKLIELIKSKSSCDSVDKQKAVRVIKPLNMKKVYLLLAILHEENNDLNRKSLSSEKGNKTLDALLMDESNQRLNILKSEQLKIFDKPWRGAEGYHFYINCHKHLHSGQYEYAMNTALNLMDYDDLIGVEEIYTLIAISSIANKNYYLASKAFIKLESEQIICERRRNLYQDLAAILFTKFPPKLSKTVQRDLCTHCETLITDYCSICPNCNVRFPVCLITGKPIMDNNKRWTCLRCKHYAFKTELSAFKNCPFCHQPIVSNFD